MLRTYLLFFSFKFAVFFAELNYSTSKIHQIRRVLSRYALTAAAYVCWYGRCSPFLCNDFHGSLGSLYSTVLYEWLLQRSVNNGPTADFFYFHAFFFQTKLKRTLQCALRVHYTILYGNGATTLMKERGSVVCPTRPIKTSFYCCICIMMRHALFDILKLAPSAPPRN